MSEIDRFPVKDLMGRYGIKRTALYNRLKALSIEPIRDGQLSYISGEQLEQLDRLDAEVRTSRQLPSSVIQRTTESLELTEQLSGQSIEQFLELAQAIALMLRPTDRYDNHETLERIARNGWLIQTRQLHELTGIKPKGAVTRWGGFRMTRYGRWWRVSKD